MMSTRESVSSVQSTGTSWMRSPARSASTSSSVSKNQPLVRHQRQQLPRLAGADRLEPALRVGEPGPERDAEQEVVAARDDLALWPADDPRAAGQPGPDRDVAVPGEQRGDEGKQRVQVRGQVHVHVREQLGVA